MAEYRSILAWISADLAGEDPDPQLVNTVRCDVCGQDKPREIVQNMKGRGEVCHPCKHQEFLSKVKTADGQPARLEKGE